MKEGSAINGAAMIQASVLLAHDVGLHARPSVKLTKLAKTFAAEVELATARQGPWIDAKSIVKVMALKARKDTTLYFRAKGADAETAVSALISLVARDFEDGSSDK
jgi:phosphocarrier protein HPr